MVILLYFLVVLGINWVKSSADAVYQSFIWFNLILISDVNTSVPY